MAVNFTVQHAESVFNEDFLFGVLVSIFLWKTLYLSKDDIYFLEPFLRKSKLWKEHCKRIEIAHLPLSYSHPDGNWVSLKQLTNQGNLIAGFPPEF